MNATSVDDLADTVPKAAKLKPAPSAPARLPGVLKRALAGIPISPWKWCAVTCALLGFSGGFRYWRDVQQAAHIQEGTRCPFPLSEIPKYIDGWTFVEGTQDQLDPEIARIAGSSDHIIRTYTKSGETVSVLVLFGLSNAVFGHTAEACYPAAGFTRASEPKDYTLTIPGDGKTAGYRAGYYAKEFAGVTSYEEVVYSFRHAGDWVADASDRWKQFRTYPGMFKIQIGRRVRGTAIESSPSIALLGDLMQQIERRLPRPPATPAQ